MIGGTGDHTHIPASGSGDGHAVPLGLKSTHLDVHKNPYKTWVNTKRQTYPLPSSCL